MLWLDFALHAIYIDYGKNHFFDVFQLAHNVLRLQVIAF